MGDTPCLFYFSTQGSNCFALQTHPTQAFQRGLVLAAKGQCVSCDVMCEDLCACDDFYFTLFYGMGVSPKQMTVHYVQRSQEDKRFQGTGITNRCEPPYGGWEMYPGPLEGQPGLLTSESLLQFHVYFAFM